CTRALLASPGPRPMRSLRACPPPAEQLLARALLAQRAVLHAQREQVPVRLSHLAPRLDPQDLHDLHAVQVGADRVELLALAQLRDARLEIVVGEGEALGLAAVARRDVGAREAVQPLE